MYYCFSCNTNTLTLNSDHGCPRCCSDFIDRVREGGTPDGNPQESYDPDFPGPSGESLTAVLADAMADVSVSDGTSTPTTDDSTTVQPSQDGPSTVNPFGVFTHPRYNRDGTVRYITGNMDRPPTMTTQQHSESLRPPSNYSVTPDGVIVYTGPTNNRTFPYPGRLRRRWPSPTRPTPYFREGASTIIAHQSWSWRI